MLSEILVFAEICIISIITINLDVFMKYTVLFSVFGIKVDIKLIMNITGCSHSQKIRGNLIKLNQVKYF